jgi:hypothetical protein
MLHGRMHRRAASEYEPAHMAWKSAAPRPERGWLARGAQGLAEFETFDRRAADRRRNLHRAPDAKRDVLRDPRPLTKFAGKQAVGYGPPFIEEGRRRIP